MKTNPPIACTVMKDWKPEGWTRPESFVEFPLRVICPDAAGYFASAGHFSNRDLKNICNFLRLEGVDMRDPAEAYNEILDRVENYPAALPLLESVAHQYRGGKKFHARSQKAITVIKKFPISKLRLKNNPDLHSRVSEICLPIMDAELAVAVFCEYSIESFYHEKKVLEQEIFDRRVFAALFPVGDKKILESEISNVKISGDWIDYASRIIDIVLKYPDVSSPEAQKRIILGIQKLALPLHTGTGPEYFEVLRKLVELGEDQSGHLAEDYRNSILKVVKNIGVPFELQNISDKTFAVLESLYASGLLIDLENVDSKIEQLEQVADDLGKKILSAQANKDFNSLSEIASMAQNNSDEIHNWKCQRETIQKILCGEILSIDDLPESMMHSDKLSRGNSAQIDDGVLIPSAHVESIDILWTGDDNRSNHARSEYEIKHPMNPELNVGSSEDSDMSESNNNGKNDLNKSLSGNTNKDGITKARLNSDDNRMNEISTLSSVDKMLDSEGTTDASHEHHEPANSIKKDFRSQNLAEEKHSKSEPINSEVKENVPENRISASKPGVNSDEPIPVDENFVAELISGDIMGVAAIIAELYEINGRAFPIEAVVLRVTAGTRAPHREYGPDAQKFSQIVNRAISERLSDIGSVLLLGSLIRPSIMDANFPFRRNLSPLCRGNLGKHLRLSVEEIGKLEYDFPPDADELAVLSKVRRVPQKQLAMEKLGIWCDTYLKKTSRWKFATTFMRHVASEQGLIGSARMAIENNSSDAIEKAKNAIIELSSQAKIESCSNEFSTKVNLPNSQLHSKGIKYLALQFDEPLGLLDNWIRAVERERGRAQRSITKFRATIRNLEKHLGKAIEDLYQYENSASDPITRAASGWIAKQTEITIKALGGSEVTTYFPTIDEALNAEQDLLPLAVRAAIESPMEGIDSVQHFLNEGYVPSPETALARACEEASFETAMRVADRFGIDASNKIRNDMSLFVNKWGAEIDARQRKLKSLAKADYAHLEEIDRHLEWCKVTLERFAATRDGDELHDFPDIPINISNIDKISNLIEDNIRTNQKERINLYRNEHNVDEATDLLGLLGELNIETIEDRIAQLRDGRSSATLHTDIEGMIRDFTPKFLDFASSPNWPLSGDDFQMAMSESGELSIDDDRRSAGMNLINLYKELMSSAPGSPAFQLIMDFFDGIGFENVRCLDWKGLGTGYWQITINGRIRSDGWFLPPIFGSKAASGFIVFIIKDNVLPENIIRALDTTKPAILLLSGVADQARRREFAERLRAGSYPALLIDEALIAFTATRRETRARTIFECGLPYGRIEPYITDSGEIPPEMFFGRTEEIRWIISKSADGCLVYGGRQLGKSALLSHVSNIYHSPQENRIVLRKEVKLLGNAEKPSEIWIHLRDMLKTFNVVKDSSNTADSVSRDIKLWLSRNPDGQIVCMFDEADYFMDADTRSDYAELIQLKQLMEDTSRSFKVVFAGLHNVQRILRQPNSPLAHLGRPICIGPLNRNQDDKRAAFDLVIQPMRSAGFRFEEKESVEEILSWANYYPSLVQEYARGLLASMHGSRSGRGYRLSDGEPLWKIPSNNLFQHDGFNDIEARVRTKFHWTLDLDPRYALIAYTLARLNAEGNVHQSLISGFGPADLLKESLPLWPKTFEEPTQTGFEALLDELFELGVLGRIQVPNANQFTYLLRTRRVAAMLGSLNDIDRALEDIKHKDPTVTYDRTVHRRHYFASGSHSQEERFYSPLTDLQIEIMLSPKSSPVQIICGLDILGLSKLGRALTRIAETSFLPRAQNGASDTPQGSIKVHIAMNERELSSLVNDRTSRKKQFCVAVFTPSDANEAENLISKIETRPMVLNGDVRPVILLDASDDGMREIANRRRDQSQFLTPWDDKMVRMHIHVIEALDLDKRDIRKSILEFTGGIPNEVQKLIKEMTGSDNPLEISNNWRVDRRLPKSILDGNLGKALKVLDLADDEDNKGDEDDDSLNQLLRETVGQDWITIGPDLRAAGLLSGWNAKHSSRNRRSSLGDLILRLIENQDSDIDDTY